MKYYDDVDVIKALDSECHKRVNAGEYINKYSYFYEKMDCTFSQTQYIVANNKLYNQEEFNSLNDYERKKILKLGYIVEETYIYSLMKYQHLIDSNSELEEEQRELLRVLLKSELHFIPFSFGDWNNGLHVIEKLNLVTKLINEKWSESYSYSYLDEDIYFITIKFENYQNKNDFLIENIENKDKDLDTFKSLEIYIAYSDYLNIYNNVVKHDVSDFWRKSLKKDDFYEK